MTALALFKKPTAFLPVVMSAGALTILLVYVVRFGAERQTDEGTAAHLWQLLMAGQVPIILFFVGKWLRAAPRPASLVLALQVAAALAAALPVALLGF